MRRFAELPSGTSALAAAAAVALLLLVAVLLPATLFGSDGAVADVAAVQLPRMPVASARPFEDYKAVFEKPVFNPNRQADPAPVAEQAKGALPALSDYRLVGVMLMGGTKLALIERRSTNQAVTLRPGEEIDGRHVEDILQNGVRFSGGDASEFLEMPRIGGFSRKSSKDVAAEKKP